MLEPALGVRVVRGPDWEWGNQDGGEGFVGTVAGLEEGGDRVVVQWDVGLRCRYRCGQNGKFDLRVLDSGPSGRVQIFSCIHCDWCQAEGLTGCVWRCGHCLDYHLCSQCYMCGRHSTRHAFFRILASSMENRERMSGRKESGKLLVRGIFAGARVIRGIDWRWGDQDGGEGTYGTVISVQDWKAESKRSVVEVQWESKKHKNIYRLGHKGKMDLKCVEAAAEACSYYPKHLPLLGADVKGEGGVASGHQHLAAGDTVKVELDVEVLKLMQEQHGGWNDTMSSLIGKMAVVNFIHEDGDPEVRYVTNHVYKFNIEAVSKVEGLTIFFVGDVVTVMDDIVLVHELQKDGPGWVDDMALTLGQVGVVTKLTLFSHVQVSVNGKRWVYNPQCLIRTADDQLPEHYGEEDVDMNARAQLLGQLPSLDRLDVIVLAASAGDVSTMMQILEKHPEEIDRMVDGRTAVHEACKEGYITVLKALLKFSPNLEILDSNGIKAVHVCAYSNCGKALSLLLEHGVDVNSKDASENTTLMVAAALGHNVVLAVILAHPLLNIQAGGAIGNTALQCATSSRRSKSVRMLLEAGADPSIADYTASTPLHHAAGIGHYPIVERMLMHFPEHINFQKEDDGYSPLHVAVANKHLDVLELFLQQPSCNINIRTSGNLTPLHIAAHEGHSAVVEMLVGYGADLNATVEDGNTPLHLIIARKSMKPLDANTPYLLQVQEKLESLFGKKTFALYTVVAAMMLLEGADLYLKNVIGQSPLFLCPSDITDVLRTVVEKCGQGSYHGSLCKFSISLPKLKRSKLESAAMASGGDIVKRFPSKDIEKGQHSDSAEKGPKLSPPGERRDKQTPESPASVHANKAVVQESQEESLAIEEDNSEDQLCCLCDCVVNVRLSPCGHSTMCSECAGTAKRCPQCRGLIKDRHVI